MCVAEQGHRHLAFSRATAAVLNTQPDGMHCCEALVTDTVQLATCNCSRAGKNNMCMGLTEFNKTMSQAASYLVGVELTSAAAAEKVACPET